ncbi:MAG: hypothetical protein ABIR52_06920 [Casimicrobiaceae bacterium]
MPKPNYAFAKRQKDLAKKQKQEAKRQRKAEAKQEVAPSQDQPPDAAVADGAGVADVAKP